MLVMYWLYVDIDVNIICVHLFIVVVGVNRQPAAAKWYDRRDAVFIEFCVEDSKDVKINFDKTKIDFR